MRIAIYAGGMPFDGETVKRGESLGGSETAAYYMAVELSNLGHEVVCFVDMPKDGIVNSQPNGPSFEWVGNRDQKNPHGHRFHYMMQTPWDVLIMQRHPQAFITPYNTKLNIWWLHDIGLIRNAKAVYQQLVNIDRVFTVSEWHRKQIIKTYDIQAENVTAIKNGVDYSMFEGIKEERISNSLFYMARPERGLENLVKKDGIMEKLPECHLYVCGYDNTTPNMRQYYEALWQRCKELPNVTNLGPLGKRELYEWLHKVMLYVYPTTFEDTSCIAVLEANAAGTPVIASKISAVPETIKDGGSILVPLKNGQVDDKQFIRKVKSVLSNTDKWIDLHTKALAKKQSWKEQAKEWDFIFRKDIAQKCNNPTRLIKHYEQMSDIEAIKEFTEGNIERVKSILPDFIDNYNFYLNDTFAEHYKAYYEYEKNRGVDYGPEDITGTARFQSIAAQLFPLLGLKEGESLEKATGTILDYGCAHGHYTITLAKMLPNCTFVGVDIEQTNIDKAIAWAEKEGLENIFFRVDSYETISYSDYEDFDVIIAAEVIEHVAKPLDCLEVLHDLLIYNGHMLLSTPYGPWEAQGYKEHKGWRAHLHHFEREDYRDIFENYFSNPKVLALPNGPLMGHYIVVYQPEPDTELCEINYKRKSCTQSPRETLSVCIIAKDAQFTLGKTLGSIKDIADEIIIGIDKTTTDDTESVAKKFGAKVIYIDPVLESGFDIARNQTINLATMDWILWLDSDETLEQPELLPQFLRNNQFNGYAIAQHHFSFAPAGILRTDYPCRIFRNNKGIKFFGIVHEHPERSLNEGVGKVFVLPGIGIMHTGYSTEKIRRGRFHRNFPLMIRDRQVYPNRELADLLWLRDIAHTVRYSLELNGGNITEEIHNNCRIIVDCFRNLIKKKKVRYSIESLQYYTEAVNILTLQGGIDFAVNLGSSKMNGGIKLPPEPFKGKFLNKQDITDFTGMLLNESLKPYEERYW
jgi:glycosyltransferase involved in cell wall biosynthesis/SAM-dependent methyltransferase